MVKKNKYWVLLVTIILVWTVISVLLFLENSSHLPSYSIFNVTLIEHFLLWIIGVFITTSLIITIQTKESKIEKLLLNEGEFSVYFSMFSAPAFLYDKTLKRFTDANDVAIKQFSIDLSKQNCLEVKELSCLIDQLHQYKNSTIRSMKVENTCMDDEGNEFYFEAILHDIYINEKYTTLILLDIKDESEKNIREMTDYIEDLHAKEDALEENAFELIQLNIRLEESENNLREVNANKDKFFSIVAHDLKSPFVGLLGITELLDTDYDEFDEKEKKELIHSLHESSKNTFELLEGLLEWARAKQGRIEYNPKIFNLFRVSDSLTNLLKASAFKKEITLINSVDVNATVYGDRDMVSTILRNLIANAIKFTPRNGMIEVKSEVENGLMKISVIDSGIGMSQEDKDKLFRIDVSHTTLGTNQEKGTGLGLILCKELIEKHGTNIWVESEKGKGSEFIFTLPLEANAQLEYSDTSLISLN